MPLDLLVSPLPVPVPAVPHLLEVAHVAHRLSASPEHVRRLIRDGKLVAFRFGIRYRVAESDLLWFIERHRVKAA